MERMKKNGYYFIKTDDPDFFRIRRLRNIPEIAESAGFGNYRCGARYSLRLTGNPL